MKIHTRKKMMDAGVLSEKKANKKNRLIKDGKMVEVDTIESQEVNFEDLASEMMATIENQQDGLDQKELTNLYREKGYEVHDITLAIAILQRKKKIVFLSD